MRVAVLGAGGWGTALATAAARAGSAVTLWARRPELARELQDTRENLEYLPGVQLSPAISVTSELGQALGQADLVLVVVPSVGVPDLLTQLPRDMGAVLCAKGLAHDGRRLSELATELGFKRLGVLSGPNHAEEIGRGLPAATVVASQEQSLALLAQEALFSSALRVYTSTDVVGVELGGVLKNVMAVAGGFVDGAELGDNAKAALMTRGLLEMRRYLVSQGAEEDTVYGLSGLGDLIATATSRHSRNRAAGEALARGENPQQGNKVVEGLRTAGLLQQWASAHGYDLPIVRAVAQVTSGHWTTREAVVSLMERDAKPE